MGSVADIAAVGIAEEQEPLLAAPALDLVFWPGDPPRYGTFVAYVPSSEQRHLVTQGVLRLAAHAPERTPISLLGNGEPFDGSMELALPAGTTVRRREVPAHDLSIADALGWLADLDAPWSARRSIAAWSDAVVAGLGLLARGRLFPAVTPEGWDAWRCGPFDPGDQRLLDAVAAALPPSAHCVPVGDGSPLKVMSRSFAVRALWDAMADTLVRTAAAPVVAGGELFAALEPADASSLTAWLTEPQRYSGGGAQVGLRIVLDPQAELADADADADAEVDADADAEVQGGGRRRRTGRGRADGFGPRPEPCRGRR